jgi:hypothetical protein
MSIETFPFGPVDTTSDQYSRLFNAVSAPGVVTGLTTSAVAGLMKVSVSAGNAVINGFSYSTDSAVQLDIDANSTGITRLDLVVAQLSVLFEDFTLEVVTGYSDEDLPYLSTEPEGLTQIPLAVVAVPNGATAITSGMITDHRQHMSSGYVIADTFADLQVSGNLGLCTDTGLVYTRDASSWTAWNQSIDASQVVSGRISSDRLPFAPEQVQVSDVGNNYTPTSLVSGKLGWSGSIASDQFNNYGGSSGNGTKLGSSAATKTLIGSSAISAYLTSAPTNPTLVQKWNAGLDTVGWISLRVFLPKILLVSTGVWSGTGVGLEVRIVNPFTNEIYWAFNPTGPYRNYTNTGGAQELVEIRIPVQATVGWAYKIEVYGWKTQTKSGNDGYLDRFTFRFSHSQNPFAEIL